MNILVTGAGGFIGRHLCKALSSHHYVIGITKHIQHIDGCHSQITCDLTNTEQALANIDEKVSIKIDTIAHLASKLVDVKTAEQMDVFHENIKISETMASLADKLMPSKLINFSTMAVYPNVDGIYSEESKIWCADNSDCLYGLSKFCAENILSFMLKRKNIKIIHLRLGQVYGDGMRDDRIMPIMRTELKETNNITIYGIGERVSSFISIQKLLEIFNIFLEKETEGVFNIGDEQISYLDMANKIIEKNGNALSSITFKDLGSKVKFYLNTNKYESLLSNKGP